MRALANLTGPWTGWSIQDGRRISESLDLIITESTISGTGTDADGNFVVEGEHDAEGTVELIRKYTYCTSAMGGVGIPYLYVGKWDGQMVHGRWSPVSYREYGGPFEMWPAKEDISIEELRSTEELLLTQ